MENVNIVAINGNLVRDMDLRQTAGGTSIGNFTVAVNSRRHNPQTGDWEDYPNFIDCAVFGKRAEALSRYLEKGTPVAVSGRLNQSRWEKDGQKRSKIEVIVDTVTWQSRGDYQTGRAPAPVQPESVDIYDEDCPF